MAETATGPNNPLVKFRGKADHELVRGKKRLPKHAKKLAARGMISEKQLKKMRGED